MYIVGEYRDTLVLRETSYDVILKAIVIFSASLMITINSGSNDTDSNIALFIVGPVLMALSFVFAIFFFKNITITLDKRTGKMTRVTWRVNKVSKEYVTLSDLNSIQIVPAESIIGDLPTKPKEDIYIKYNDSEHVKINYYNLKSKKSYEIGTTVARFLDLPFAIIKKPGVLESISSLKNIIKK